MSEISKIICTDGLRGSISIKIEDKIRLRLNLTLPEPLPETDVIKAMLLCRAQPDLPSVNCGTAEMHGTNIRLTGTYEVSSELIRHIDTAEIIRKNVFTEECESIIKLSLVPEGEPSQVEPVPENNDGTVPESDAQLSMDEIRHKLSQIEDNSAYKAYLSLSEDLKSPVERAAEALESLQNFLSRGNEADAHKRCMADIRRAAEEYDTVNCGMPPDYTWHRITRPAPLTNAASFGHILCSAGAIRAFEIYGHYLLGIKREEDEVCVAVPVGTDDPNPIACVDDCTVYVRPGHVPYEYCTVCILFLPDGQYFAPLC